MTVYKLLNKNRNKNNIITSYTLIDQQGKRVDVNPIELKAAIKSKKVRVLGLTLTSDFRLVDGAAIKPAPVKKPVAQRPVVQVKKQKVEADKHRFEIVAQLIINSKPVGYILLDKYRYHNDGNGIEFILRDEIKDYDTNMIDGKIIWRNAAKARKIQKVLSETVRSQIPNKDMNFEYDIADATLDEGYDRHEFIETACREAKIFFDELKGQANPLKYFMQAVKKNNPEGLDDYNKYCVDKMISVLGTLQLTQDILDDNEYMYYILDDNVEDFYEDYLRQQRWLINIIEKICSRNNKAIPGNRAIYYLDDAGNISTMMEKALYKNLLQGLLKDPKNGFSTVRDNYNKMCKICEDKIKGLVKNEEDLNKTVFRITKSHNAFDDDSYTDTAVLTYGYKSAIGEYINYLDSQLTEIFGEFTGLLEDYSNTEEFLNSRNITVGRLFNEKVSISIM